MTAKKALIGLTLAFCFAVSGQAAETVSGKRFGAWTTHMETSGKRLKRCVVSTKSNLGDTLEFSLSNQAQYELRILFNQGATIDHTADVQMKIDGETWLLEGARFFERPNGLLGMSFQFSNISEATMFHHSLRKGRRVSQVDNFYNRDLQSWSLHNSGKALEAMMNCYRRAIGKGWMKRES